MIEKMGRTCNICGKDFKSIGGMKLHRTVKHEGEIDGS